MISTIGMPPFAHGFGGHARFGGRRSAHDRHNADLQNSFANCLLLHGIRPFVEKFRQRRIQSPLRAARINLRTDLQRAMRAPTPFITCNTSSSVAIDVSPGVVIASAPCAAPQSTANCASLPARNP